VNQAKKGMLSMLKESTSIFCKQCKIDWPIRNGDTFCGYCGAKVADYEFALVGGPAYVDELNNVSLQLSLRNTGSTPVPIRNIQTKASWLTVEERGPLVLPVENSSREIGLAIDKSNLSTRIHHELKSIIEVHPVGEFPKKELMVEIFSTPTFEFSEEEVKFEHSKSKQEVSVELNILVRKSIVIFDEIQPQNCSDWLEILPPPELGKELKAGDNLVITALLDLEKMPGKDKTEVTFSFKLKERQNNETKSFKLVPLLAPELRIDEAIGNGRIQITTTKDKKQEFQLQLRNAGGGEIDLSRFNCKPCPDWLKLSTHQPVLQKDEQSTLTISIDGKTAPEGKNSFELIHPEKDKIFAFPFFLELTVRSLPEYPHHLAVDFGTTNSCCAFINQRHEPELIVFDRYIDAGMVVENELISSTIVYTDEDNGEFTYLVGQKPYEISPQEYAGNYFPSIKRAIGSDEGRYITIDNGHITKKPYQIAADIIRHVLEKSEEQLEQKIARCVITHPTMFSQREVDELRQIYTDELGIKEILMLDEATAASLDYIFQRNKKNKGKPETYCIVVYDFGGGTTDIALLLVNAGEGTLKIEPLDVGGSRRLGGDDITELIVQHILKEYQERLETKHEQSLISIDIPFCPLTELYKSSGDEELDRKVRDNSNQLYRAAENIKIELSNKMSEEIEKRSNPTAAEIKKRGKQINIERPIGLSVSVGGEFQDIQEELSLEYSLIEEWFLPKLDDMLAQVDSMFEDIEEHPKVILLAGQSSAIPSVKLKLAERFNEATVVSAEELKGCVAVGSSRYARVVAHHTEIGRSDPIEVIEFTSKTHSAYGISTINEFFEEEFQTVIPKRASIPDESHGTFKMRLRKHAVVPVYENTGVKNMLEGNEEIQLVGSYIYDFSADGVAEEELQEVELEMSMGRDEKIDVVANINGKPCKFIRQEL